MQWTSLNKTFFVENCLVTGITYFNGSKYVRHCLAGEMKPTF
jgi:hypothetical protein